MLANKPDCFRLGGINKPTQDVLENACSQAAPSIRIQVLRDVIIGGEVLTVIRTRLTDNIIVVKLLVNNLLWLRTQVVPLLLLAARPPSRNIGSMLPTLLTTIDPLIRRVAIVVWCNNTGQVAIMRGPHSITTSYWCRRWVEGWDRVEN